MMYLGDYLAGTTVDFMWSTNGADGASITRATNGTVSVYKANNTTQTTTGVTDTEDFDSLTGIHHCRIATSDAFYATGNDYMVVLSAATIDGKTVNAVLALFSIENRNTKANLTHISGSAVSTSTAQLGVNAVQAGGTAWVSGAITGSAVAAGAIHSTALSTAAKEGIADAVWDEPIAGHTDLATTGGQLGEAGADDSEVVAAAVWDLDMTGHTVAGTFGEAMDNAGGGSSPADIADAVWDEALSGHTTAGTAGAGMAYARDGSAVYGSTTAAENLKKWFDGTGYNAAGSTVGTATNVSNAVNANVTNIQGNSALMTAFANMLATAVQATVVAGTNTTTVISTGLTSSVNDFYKGKMLFVKTGALAGQGGKLVTAYDGATKRLTVEALTAALSPDDVVVLVG